MSRLAWGLFVVALVASPRVARADDHAIAEALFQAGKSLMNEGKIDEACPKLQESQRIEPGGGTLLLLGMCHQQQGKLASAVAELRSAQSMARRDHRLDREKLATKHLAELEGKVSTVLVRTANRDATLRVDGTVVSAEVASVPLPIDPGAHTIEVSAKGKKTRVVKLTVGAVAENRTLDVPALEDEPVAKEPTREAPKPERGAAPPPGDPGATQRIVGWSLVGAGAVAVGVGAVFGVKAIGDNADAKDACDPARCTSAEGLAKNDDARASATVANVVVGLGLAVVTTGIVVVLLAPKASAARAPGTIFRF